jgi:hypothetical protein
MHEELKAILFLSDCEESDPDDVVRRRVHRVAEVPNKTPEDVNTESEDKLQGEMERPITARRRRFVRGRQQAEKLEEAKLLPFESSAQESVKEDRDTGRERVRVLQQARAARQTAERFRAEDRRQARYESDFLNSFYNFLS